MDVMTCMMAQLQPKRWASLHTKQDIRNTLMLIHTHSGTVL